MGRTKKLFDKKSSIRFKLVHRSQRDPLAADETAPQMVLVDMDDNGGGSGGTDRQRQRIEEHRKYGIHFDDDYDYLQHLRDVDQVAEWHEVANKDKTKKTNQPKTANNKTSGVSLPSSLFPSAVEEREGLLNKAVLPVGPQPDWDPDLVAAMDDDYDFDDPNNQMDDDFIMQAEGVDEEVANDDDDDQWEDVSDSDSSTVCDSDEDNDSDSSGNGFSDEETKSHFTNYSMSSSVMRRNNNLTILDQRFETLYETEYANDCDIGGLDLDDIEGPIQPNNSKLLADLAEEYANMKNVKQLYENVDKKEFYEFYDNKREEADNCDSNRPKDRGEVLTEIEIYENSKNREDRYDCESIISTYSNLYNRPKMISESNNKQSSRIQINERTGLPVGCFEKPGLTAKKLAKLNALNDAAADNNDLPMIAKSVRTTASRVTELSVRPADETPEQRKHRKSELRDYRRQRRVEKKVNKEAFKTESLRLNKEVINLQKSFNSVKIV
ncbi:protein LTV1 homolog [Oppia nitens]|uniref:protein LTV1 homolog n=1 Tax=Oppia nitens TaxID=1686743 RepID=UPI0023D9F5BD|nr:protein LTV1 homolog [Oppia nitens]